MLKIGLTGGIGSGKTTVAKYFAKLGAKVIDSDIIAREVVAPNTLALTKIAKHFGKDILTTNGELDRHHLRNLIFKDHTQKKWLEKLLHPLIYQEMAKQIKQVTAPYCILVIPLLLETKHEKFVDRILVVDSSPEQQIGRITNRDKISIKQTKAMLAAQLTREQRLKKADDVIHNDGSLYYLNKQVKELHEKYLHH